MNSLKFEKCRTLIRSLLKNDFAMNELEYKEYMFARIKKYGGNVHWNMHVFKNRFHEYLNGAETVWLFP